MPCQPALPTCPDSRRRTEKARRPCGPPGFFTRSRTSSVGIRIVRRLHMTLRVDAIAARVVAEAVLVLEGGLVRHRMMHRHLRLLIIAARLRARRLACVVARTGMPVVGADIGMTIRIERH